MPNCYFSTLLLIPFTLLLGGSIDRIIQDRPCSVRLSLSSLILHAQFCLLWLISGYLECTDFSASDSFSTFMVMFLFLTALGIMAAAISTLVMLVLTHFRGEKCAAIGWLISDWIVSILVVVALIALVCSLLYIAYTRARDRIELRRARREIQRLFEIIYDPTEEVDLLMEKYKERVLTEPLSEKELAILTDFFCRTYDLDQSGIDEESAECCTICYQPLQFGKLILSYPVCGHKYDFDCVAVWLEQKLVCPMCKLDLRPAMVRAIRQAHLASKNKQNAKQ